MMKIKNNIFLLSLTTLFLFLSCLVINSYSNKYSAKANFENQIILTYNDSNRYMCDIEDTGSNFFGGIFYDMSLVFYISTYEFNFEFYKIENSLNYIGDREHFYSLSFIIDDINNNGDSIPPSSIVNFGIYINYNFDFTQYPIESAFEYTNPELDIEVELELNSDFLYFNSASYDIPFNTEFDNPYVISLNSFDNLNIKNDTYSWGFEEGYNRGYHDGYSDGLSLNNCSQAYEQGYDDGYNDSSLNPMTFIRAIFSGINDIFNVEIFPEFKIWYLIGAPLIVALIVGVLKFLR